MQEAKALQDKTKKPFKVLGDQIEQKIENIGSCFATDRILVDGAKVGYMYREEPDDEIDSGWRFLAGDETDEYLDDQWNSGIYSVNTICNYDTDIMQFLKYTKGTSFARDPQTGLLTQLHE